MKTFYASDYHINHANIIKYDKRPFSSLEEMREEIIKRHNEVVKPGDHFYFLGDLFLGDEGVVPEMENVLRRLNGNKFFIKGNHDHKETIKLYEKFGTYLGEQKEIKVSYNNDRISVILNHFPMYRWDKSHRGSFHLYGHEHGALTQYKAWRCLDVGIMNNNYKPFSFEEIYKELIERVNTPHH